MQRLCRLGDDLSRGILPAFFAIAWQSDNLHNGRVVAPILLHGNAREAAVAERGFRIPGSIATMAVSLMAKPVLVRSTALCGSAS
jgi:hypothetical protein